MKKPNMKKIMRIKNAHERIIGDLDQMRWDLDDLSFAVDRIASALDDELFKYLEENQCQPSTTKVRTTKF